MSSFIIVSKDLDKRREYLHMFYKKHQIDNVDVTVVSFDNSVKQNMQSIGIEEIKLMQKKVFLKPIKSKTKAVVLDDAELLTTEAQNALLKILEEPPDNTLIVLATNSKDNLLPTIISRCFLIDLGHDQLIISEKEREELQEFLNEFPKWGIGERLKKAEVLAKDKEQALVWIEQLIIVAREKMLKEAHDALDTFDTLDTLRKFQSLHTLLKTTNVNLRFAIEHTLLLI